MATAKRGIDADDDTTAWSAKKTKKDTTSAGPHVHFSEEVKSPVEEFMEDFPPMKESVSLADDSPLPSTFLSEDEMQGAAFKPQLRSPFNVKLPTTLSLDDEPSAEDAPYEWLQNQYSHCIVPEVGEEYDFAFDSQTFHTLRDLHNARVGIRDSEFLPGYIICSLATRWISLEENDRPATDGYLANGEIFVATFLPLTRSERALQQYLESQYTTELSAQHYIPRSKYSVHFVGPPVTNIRNEIQDVHVCSVVIRNTRTGRMVYIDTGDHTERQSRATRARRVLQAWLEFQTEKCPKSDLGPTSRTFPIVLDVDKETDPSLRSLHAIVSASLFLRRRITNWGDVKAFWHRNNPNSTSVANWALRSLSGWLGLKIAPKASHNFKQTASSSMTVHTFEYIYLNSGLRGRAEPAPKSRRIISATKGGPPVFNEEPDLSNDDIEHEESATQSDEDSVDGDQPNSDKTLKKGNPKDDRPKGKDRTAKNPKNKKRAKGDSGSQDADHQSADGDKSKSSRASAKEETTGKDPADEAPAEKEPDHEDANAKKSSKDGEAGEDGDDDRDVSATT